MAKIGAIKTAAKKTHANYVQKAAGTKFTAYANVAQVGGAGVAGAAVARDRYQQRAKKKKSVISPNPGTGYRKVN